MVATIKNTELVWVDQTQTLNDVAKELSSESILAVDTESNSLYAYQEQVCLIQFSTPTKDILVDTLALPNLSPLAKIFSSKEILKVFHAAEYDLICLFRDYGFRFNNLFDTMIAARTLGHQQIGLGALLKRHFNIQMDKKYQRANWGRRPIKKEMLEYARLDSHYLIPLQEKLRAELKSSGRWELALEDFRRLTQNIEDTTESSEEDYWKLRGARDLNPQQSAVLKSIYQFRDAQAKAQDQPPFKIFSNQVMLELAQTCPHYKEELPLLPALNDRVIRRYGKGLLKAVREGMKASPPAPPKNHKPENGTLEIIDALKEWRKQKGQKLGVPSDVVLPKDVLCRLAHSNPTDLKSLKTQMYDVPYRFNRFGKEILDTIRKGIHSS
jgi:ribonuclease D